MYLIQYCASNLPEIFEHDQGNKSEVKILNEAFLKYLNYEFSCT